VAMGAQAFGKSMAQHESARREPLQPGHLHIGLESRPIRDARVMRIIWADDDQGPGSAPAKAQRQRCSRKRGCPAKTVAREWKDRASERPEKQHQDIGDEKNSGHRDGGQG